MVSADFGLRMVGIPSLPLWECLLPRFRHLFVHGDNQAMIQVVKTGKNPTMRYLGRTHGVSIPWLHE